MFDPNSNSVHVTIKKGMVGWFVWLVGWLVGGLMMCDDFLSNIFFGQIVGLTLDS